MVAVQLLFAPAAIASEVLRFGVVNQRSPQLTAEYWNPILDYVSRRSGARLELRLGRAAPETTEMAERGVLDFYLTNHLFTAERARLGWRVFGRIAGEPIRGEIVVADDSPIRQISDLQGRDVVFPSPEAFVGYWVPTDALLAAGVQVKPRFAGNQEGAMAQLQAGRADAAAVNAKVMAEYARRESMRYRAIWRSGPFYDLALMAHPRVPAEIVEAVRSAFTGMAGDPEGLRILEASAALIRQKPPLGFVAADDGDYDDYRRFHRVAQARVDRAPKATVP